MPVTGLYQILDCTKETIHQLQDRLAKVHQPVFTGRWAAEYKLYRETPLPPPSSPIDHHSHTHGGTSVPIHHQSTEPQKITQTLEFSTSATRLLVNASGKTLVCIDQTPPSLPPLPPTSTPAAAATSSSSTNPTQHTQQAPQASQPTTHHLPLLVRDFDILLRTKLSSLWTIRQTLKLAGDCYELEDFRVKLGIITQQQVDNLKGVVLEVEYAGVGFLSVGKGVIRDFVEGLGVRIEGVSGESGKNIGMEKERGKGRWTWRGREFVDVQKKDEGRNSTGGEKAFGFLDTGRQYMELLGKIK